MLLKIKSLIFNLYFFGKWKRIYISKNSSLKTQNICFGDNIFLDTNVEIRNRIKENSYIGSNVTINRNTVIRGKFEIGNDVMIGPNVLIIGVNHNFSEVTKLMRQQGVSAKGVKIGNNCWIGGNATILDGVEISDGCVVGGGCVVSKSIPKDSIVVGNPCRIIRKR